MAQSGQLSVPVIQVPPPDLPSLATDDARRVAEGLPYRFAVPHDVIVTPEMDGVWDIDADGNARWQLRIASQRVPHINLGFAFWQMPDSGEMVVAATDGSYGLTPFTALDNMPHGELWLPIVRADDILLTITCLPEDAQAVRDDITLTSINVGYRGFGVKQPTGTEGSGSCNVDVVCSQGDPWFAEIPCVGVYAVSGWWTCSGGMLNNTAEDQRPFFLTANHCGVNTGNDQTMVVYWNYENSYCRTGGGAGGSGNGNTNQYTSGGSVVRASSSGSDFTLVELNNDPNSSYEVTFCGWDRRTVTPQQGVGIHHPQLQEKRISFDYNSLSSDGSYWRVNDWDLGTTEPGSSGSLLFNQDHRVVGQLYGGTAACSNNGYDIYGKVSVSWNAGMGSWLDYAGTGDQYIDTLGSEPIPVGACCVGSGGTCIEIPESNCNVGGGTYLGDGVECDDGGCESDSCPSDVTGDNVVDVSDILAVIGAWGPCSGCDEDIDDSGVVDVSDILAVIGAWGDCP